MTSFKWVVLTTLAALINLSSAGTLQNITKSGKFRVCFDAGYMPFEMKAKNGEVIGFDIDLGKSIAKAIGVKFVGVNTSWDGIIPALLTDKCDAIMGGMTITAKRNMKVNFSNPYVIIGQTILLSPKLAGKIKSYKDLNNSQYTVVSKLGTTGAAAAKRYIPKAQHNVFETESDGSMEVIVGKADAFVYDLPYNAIYALQHKGKIIHLSKPFTYEPLGIAIHQNDPDMLNFINNYLQQIHGDGTYDRLYNKWFKSTRWLSKIQ
ncbi:MAG: transporter substrate-binding domain-containing protein [Ostreibacterium sp.]